MKRLKGLNFDSHSERSNFRGTSASEKTRQHWGILEKSGPEGGRGRKAGIKGAIGPSSAQ